MEEFQNAQEEIEKKNDTKAVSQKMFKVVSNATQQRRSGYTGAYFLWKND